jgi:hypothetical protein
VAAGTVAAVMVAVATAGAVMLEDTAVATAAAAMAVDTSAAAMAGSPHPSERVFDLDQNNKRCDGLSSAHSGEWRKHLEDVMTILKSLTIVAVLLVSGISLAMAQNGLPTGGEHPVAGGAAGGPYYGHVYRRGYGYGPYRHLYNYYRPYHRYRHY